MAGYKVFLGLNGSDVNRILKAKPSIAVIDFAEFGDTQIKKLKVSGIKLISYLNVGAIEKTRPYYAKYKKYAIGNYSDWDEKWMNLSKKEGYVWGAIRTALASVSDVCIIQMQDILNLGAEGRMNFPGTLSDSNWTWRAKDGIINPALAEKVGALTKLYCRIGIQK